MKMNTRNHRIELSAAVISLILPVLLLGAALSGCSLLFPVSYTVTFDSMGGSAVAPSEGIREGDLLSEPTAPTKAGYSFAGWYADVQLTAAWTFSSDTVTAAATLYAKWTADTDTAYTVEHYQQDVSGGGYTKVTADTESLAGTTSTTATATAKTYTGFREHTTHADRAASGTIVGDGSLVLKLYYDRDTFTVSYEENGGSSVTDTTDVRYGAMISAPTAPTKDGYAFDGWYTDDSFTTAWNFGSDTVTAAATLYAKWTELGVGDTGPAGGLIFYDKGSCSDGWRYLEAAPYGWYNEGADPEIQWDGSSTTLGVTSTGIGTGNANTDSIVEELGAGAYAAKACADYSITVNGVVYDDWFLPSKDELNQMYQNLHSQGKGGFSSNYYWSSSEYSNTMAWMQYFDDGGQYINFKSYNHSHRVRAVRTL